MSNTDAAAGGELIDSKSAITSVATWGIVIAAASQMVGVPVSPADTAQVVHAIQDAISTYKEIILAIGVIMAAVGRYNAKQPLHFLQPYQVDATGKKVVPVPLDVKAAMVANPEKPA